MKTVFLFLLLFKSNIRCKSFGYFFVFIRQQTIYFTYEKKIKINHNNDYNKYEKKRIYIIYLLINKYLIKLPTIV